MLRLSLNLWTPSVPRDTLGIRAERVAHERLDSCRRLSKPTVEKVTESMSAAPAFHRTPLVISAGQLVAGPVNATYRDGDRESLLHNYLVLIRQIRGEQREPTITLRGADISALAEHLGASEERVLEDLLDRMGATRAQRKALLAMFAAGVLTIVATGSIALDLAPAGVLAQGGTTEGVVGVPAVDVELATTTAPAAQTAAPMVSVDVPEPEMALAIGGADWEYTLSLHKLALALAEPLADAEPIEGVGVADDGSVVAVGQPPLPMPEGVGVADDGSVVAVGQPPLPMPEGVGVADDGSVVGVGQPPLP
jgi:hypothetical protein